MLDGISSSRQGWVLQRLGFQGRSHEPQHPLNKLSLVAFFEWKMDVGLVRGLCCGSNWARLSFPFFSILALPYLKSSLVLGIEKNAIRPLPLP